MSNLGTGASYPNPWRRHGASSSSTTIDSLAQRQLDEFQKSLSPAQQKEWLDCRKETSPELLGQNLINFASRLYQHGDGGKAQQLWQTIASLQNLTQIDREQATRELKSISGTGAFGENLSYQLDRLRTEACDYKMILPMMAGTIIGQTARAGLLRQLVSSPGLARIPGWGLEALATSGSLLAEVPGFVAAQRLLQPHSQRSLGDDLLSNALTLGTLKIAGSFSGSMWRRSGLAGKFADPARAASAEGILQQASSMFGLAASHWLEAKAGLAPEQPLSLINLLGTQLSLAVGGSLGHRFLGNSWNAFQTDIGLRSQARESSNSSFNFDLLNGGLSYAVASSITIHRRQVPQLKASSPLEQNTISLSQGGEAPGAKPDAKPTDITTRRIPEGVDRPLFDSLNSYAWKAPADEINRPYDATAERPAEWDEIARLHHEVAESGIKILLGADLPAHALIARLSEGLPLIAIGAKGVFQSERWGTIDLRGLAAENPLHYYPGNVRQAQLFRDLAILLDQPDLSASVQRKGWGANGDAIFQTNRWNQIPTSWRRFLWLDRHLDIGSYRGIEGYNRLAIEHFEGDPHRTWLNVRPFFESRREMKRITGWPMMKKVPLEREAEILEQLTTGLDSGAVKGEEGYDLFAYVFFGGDSTLAWNAARSLLSVEDFLKLGWRYCKVTNTQKQGEIRTDLLNGTSSGSYLGTEGYNAFALKYFGGNSARAWQAAISLLSPEQFAATAWPRRKVTNVKEEEGIRNALTLGISSGSLIGEKGSDQFAKDFFKGNSATARQAAASLLPEREFEKLQWRIKVTRVGEEDHHRRILRQGLASGDFFGERGLMLYSELLFSEDQVHAWQVARSVLSDVEFLLLGWEHPDSEGLGLGHALVRPGKRANLLSDQYPPPLAPEVVERFLLLMAAKPRTLGKRLIRLIREHEIDDLGLNALLQLSEIILETFPKLSNRKKPSSEHSKPDTTETSAPVEGNTGKPETSFENRPANPDLERLFTDLAAKPGTLGPELIAQVRSVFGSAPAIQIFLSWLESQIKMEDGVTPVKPPPAPTKSEDGVTAPSPETTTEISPATEDEATAPQSNPEPKPPEPETQAVPEISSVFLPDFEAIPILADYLDTYPEIGMLKLEKATGFVEEFLPRIYTPEGKTLIQLAYLLTRLRIEDKKDAKKIDDVAKSIWQGLESQRPMTSLLESAFRDYVAVREIVINDITPVAMLNLFPEIGIPQKAVVPLQVIESLHAFLAKKPLDQYAGELKKIAAPLFASNGLQLDPNAFRQKAPSYLQALAHFYVRNRDKIRSIAEIALEDWEKQPYEPGQIPEEILRRIRTQAPELRPASATSPASKDPQFASEHLTELLVSFNLKFVALKPVQDLKARWSRYDWRILFDQYGGRSPENSKAIVEYTFSEYLKIRAELLQMICNRPQFGLEGIFNALGIGFNATNEFFFPEADELRAMIGEPMPPLATLLRGQAHKPQKDLRKTSAEILNQTGTAQAIDHKMMRELASIRKSAHRFILKNIAELSADFQAPELVELESRRESWSHNLDHLPNPGSVDLSTFDLALDRNRLEYDQLPEDKRELRFIKIAKVITMRLMRIGADLAPRLILHAQRMMKTEANLALKRAMERATIRLVLGADPMWVVEQWIDAIHRHYSDPNRVPNSPVDPSPKPTSGTTVPGALILSNEALESAHPFFNSVGSLPEIRGAGPAIAGVEAVRKLIHFMNQRHIEPHYDPILRLMGEAQAEQGLNFANPNFNFLPFYQKLASYYLVNRDSVLALPVIQMLPEDTRPLDMNDPPPRQMELVANMVPELRLSSPDLIEKGLRARAAQEERKHYRAEYMVVMFTAFASEFLNHLQVPAAQDFIRVGKEISSWNNFFAHAGGGDTVYASYRTGLMILDAYLQRRGDLLPLIALNATTKLPAAMRPAGPANPAILALSERVLPLEFYLKLLQRLDRAKIDIEGNFDDDKFKSTLAAYYSEKRGAIDSREHIQVELRDAEPLDTALTAPDLEASLAEFPELRLVTTETLQRYSGQVQKATRMDYAILKVMTLFHVIREHPALPTQRTPDHWGKLIRLFDLLGEMGGDPAATRKLGARALLEDYRRNVRPRLLEIFSDNPKHFQAFLEQFDELGPTLPHRHDQLPSRVFKLLSLQAPDDPETNRLLWDFPIGELDSPEKIQKALRETRTQVDKVVRKGFRRMLDALGAKATRAPVSIEPVLYEINAMDQGDAALMTKSLDEASGKFASGEKGIQFEWLDEKVETQRITIPPFRAEEYRAALKQMGKIQLKLEGKLLTIQANKVKRMSPWTDLEIAKFQLESKILNDHALMSFWRILLNNVRINIGDRASRDFYTQQLRHAVCLIEIGADPQWVETQLVRRIRTYYLRKRPEVLKLWERDHMIRWVTDLPEVASLDLAAEIDALRPELGRLSEVDLDSLSHMQGPFPRMQLLLWKYLGEEHHQDQISRNLYAAIRNQPLDSASYTELTRDFARYYLEKRPEILRRMQSPVPPTTVEFSAATPNFPVLQTLNQQRMNRTAASMELLRANRQHPRLGQAIESLLADFHPKGSERDGFWAELARLADKVSAFANSHGAELTVGENASPVDIEAIIRIWRALADPEHLKSLDATADFLGSGNLEHAQEGRTHDHFLVEVISATGTKSMYIVDATQAAQLRKAKDQDEGVVELGQGETVAAKDIGMVLRWTPQLAMVLNLRWIAEHHPDVIQLVKQATAEMAQRIRRLGQLAAAQIALGADPTRVTSEFIESILEIRDHLPR